MILAGNKANPTHIVPRRNGGVRIAQGPSVVYLSALEVEALADALCDRIQRAKTDD